MTTVDFSTALFCRVDAARRAAPKHPQACLFPSEVTTWALLFALTGDGDRAFSRWLTRDYRPLFPRLPERTRLFRLEAAHQGWTARFLAQPTVLGVADSYGVELLHPYREKRHPLPDRLGRKGLSNHRWIVGGTRAVVLNQGGLVCGWDAETATGQDSAFHALIDRFAEDMIVWADGNFARKEGNPSNLKVCPRGTWNDRMLVETTFSLLTLICPLKTAQQRGWQPLPAWSATNGKVMTMRRGTGLLCFL